jgi:4-aminobutyrate aminotransferase / (S)-3-amino-2-methylpropionate transaminase / 5-aminovalerate transaminase
MGRSVTTPTRSKPLAAEDLAARDKKYVLRPWADDPLVIVEAADCTLTDAAGKQYLDFTAGYFVNNAGHCRAEVMEAAAEQMKKVTQVSGKQSTPPQIALAEKLVQLGPRPLAKVLFSTGGSEANEFAFKMARQHTKKPALAALENSYHGLTLGALEACANAKYRDTAGLPGRDHVYFVPTPYCYRCAHAGDCETQCLDEAEKKLDARPDTAALVAEPVQAVGGIIPPAKWWTRMEEIRRKRKLLLIIDEIQTGVGRTGKMFASEHYGLEPDILTGGKGLSGGVGSLAVTMCSDPVAEGFAGGTTPTSGGNAASAAAGIALIEVILEEGLLHHCTRMGEYLTEAVARLADPWVGDIRFKGLLGGVELVLDKTSKEPVAKKSMEQIRLGLQERGIVMTVSGLLGNVLRLQPPLTIRPNHIDVLVAALAEVLPAVRAKTS